MKKASWKVLVQAHLKAFFVVIFCCLCWACCQWASGYMPVPGTLISTLSSTGSRAFRACSHPMKPQVGWEDRHWARGKKDSETTQFCMFWARLNVAHTLPLASSEASDVVSRCVWLLSHCHGCPSGGRSVFLVFSTALHGEEWMLPFSIYRVGNICATLPDTEDWCPLGLQEAGAMYVLLVHRVIAL